MILESFLEAVFFGNEPLYSYIKFHINPYLVNVSILYLLKALENFCFSGVVRGLE